MNKYRNIILAIALMCCSSASIVAQDALNKEIVVAKDYVPTEQKATKLNNLPEVTKAEVANTTLEYSDWTVPTTVKPSHNILMPLGYANLPNTSLKRGYVNFGMGTLLNITGSAGYKILNDKLNTLNVWLQHNSTYGEPNSTINSNSVISPYSFDKKFINDILGVDYSRLIGGNVLSANAYYRFSHFNYIMETPYENDDLFQNVNEFKLGLSYGTAPKKDGLKYQIGLSYDHFGYKFGVKENNFMLNGDISTQIGEESRLGLDLKGDVLHYSSVSSDYKLTSMENVSNGMFSLSPYYQIQNEKTNFKVGLNIDISFNDGTIFRFSPNIKFDYKLGNKVIFYADMNGGKTMNKFSDITTINPYISPRMIVGSTYTPLDFVAGLKFGTFSGFTAKVWGGYAIVKNQQLPWRVSDKTNDIITNNNPLETTRYIHYNNTDMSGFQVGAELGYKYANVAELKAKFAYSPQGEGKGYLFSHDRPEYIIGADLTVNPIEKLKFIVSYDFQGNRNMYSKYMIEGPLGIITEGVDEFSLGNINQLRLHASYTLNDTFSFFAQGNNLINAKWDRYILHGEQKINFLAGVNIQF